MNGYKNEETFDMGLIIDNSRELYWQLENMRENGASVKVLADFMKDAMERDIDLIVENLPNSAAGLAIAQMVNTAMAKIEWKELAETV